MGEADCSMAWQSVIIPLERTVTYVLLINRSHFQYDLWNLSLHANLQSI
jgi:hypothetical protein